MVKLKNQPHFKIIAAVLLEDQRLNMELTVFKERNQSTLKVNFSGRKVKELLQQLNINPETIIIVRNSEVITDDEILNPNDHLKLLSVISGG